jgi:hypothetical protein
LVYPRLALYAPLCCVVCLPRGRAAGSCSLLVSLGVLPVSCGLSAERLIMNAVRMFSNLRFVGGRPLLILRDHEAGRIKVFLEGVWAFTIIPGELLAVKCEAVLLGCWDAGYDNEERTTWDGVAFALSEFQQTGSVPCMTYEGFVFEDEADQREDSICNDMNACDEAFDDGAYERMQQKREQRYLENDANWVK